MEIQVNTWMEIQICINWCLGSYLIVKLINGMKYTVYFMAINVVHRSNSYFVSIFNSYFRIYVGHIPTL